MTAPPTSSALQCPLCGQANQCAMAAGQAPETCWCMATPVAPEALAQIPVEARGKVCICPLCAQPRPVPDSREGVAAGPAPI
ncbi:cysteine-rich CWC family protein [Acidovorax sp.]|uniref:cysteine-rich CWC family protein n=1 Tax=Acidovorax sp. TaxID=1872122 RepID=UPI00391FAE03